METSGRHLRIDPDFSPMCEDRGHFWLSLVAMHRVGFVMLETPDRLAWHIPESSAHKT